MQDNQQIHYTTMFNKLDVFNKLHIIIFKRKIE